MLPRSKSNPVYDGNSTRFRQNADAFSLIELLVVISIITLMVSILLPSLNIAREQARATKCGINIRNLHMMLMMYADDNNEKLPYQIYSEPTTGKRYLFTQWLWDNYLEKQRGYLICPTETEFITFSPGYWYPHYGFFSDSSRGSFSGMRISDIQFADRSPWTADHLVKASLGLGVSSPFISSWGYSYRMSYYGHLGRLDPRHFDEKMNIGFMDGHTELMDEELVVPWMWQVYK